MKSLLTSGLSSLAIKVGGIAALFTANALAARTLGTDLFGEYSYLLSVFVALSIPIQGGVGPFAVRTTSRLIDHNSINEIRILVKWLQIRIFLYSAVTCALVALYSMFSSLRIDLVHVYGLLVLLGVPSLVLYSYVYRGLGFKILGLLPDQILFPGFLVIFFGSLSVLKKDFSYYLLAYGASAILSGLIARNFVNRHIKKLTSIETSSIVVDKSGFIFLSLVGAANLLFGQLDIIMLGIFSTSVDAGVYKAMFQLSSLVIFGLSAVNQVLFTDLERYFRLKEMRLFQETVAKGSLIILVLSLVPALILCLFGKEIILFIYGEEYSSGYPVLLILLIGNVVNAFFGSVGAILNMTGHEKDSLLGLSISILIMLFSGVFLARHLGGIGMAISFALSIFSWNIVLYLKVKRRINIESIGIKFYLNEAISNRPRRRKF